MDDRRMTNPKGGKEADMPVDFMDRKSERGFSLIELIVVLVILGLLAAVVAPNVYNKLAKGKDQIAKIQIKELEGALQLYSFDMGQYPATAEGLEALVRNPGSSDSWKGPYLSKELPKDPWGRPYLYRSPGMHGDFDLYSAGADGTEGNEDDICSWN
jgi:general secretion pathway protein G